MTRPGTDPTAARRGVDRLRWRDVPFIMMYHAVDDVDADPHRLAVSPGRFAEQMAWLRRRGLRGVAAGELVRAVRAGSARGLVGLTFDDGYAGLLDHAVPVLRRHGFGATVFAVADRVGGVNDWDRGPVWPLLDAGGVRAIAEAGFEIGSHGLTHTRLAGADRAVLAEEVVTSRERLADLIGRPVDGFCYPYGSNDRAAREAVLAAGYTYACAVNAPRSAPGLSALPRLYIGESDNSLRLAVKHTVHRPYSWYSGEKK